jgi:YVTN family beta-propeller protein
MFHSIRRLAFLVGFFAATHLFAENTPSPALVVLAKTDRTLSIVDPATLKVIGKLPSGPDPHEVVVSSDGKYAYISNYGGGAYNTLSVVDLVAQKALPPVDLGALRGPHGLVFVAGKVWFTAEPNKVIGRYDPDAKKVDWVLGTGQDRTHMIFVSEDQKRIITSNVSAATMTIIEPASPRGPGPGPGGPRGSPQGEWAETVIAVGRGAEGFDVSPDGRELWAANAQDGTISVIDVSGKKVIETLAADVRGANRLKFTPDGKLVFISTLGGPELVIYDAAAHKLVKRVKIGRGAAGIEMQPDGKRAFVSCTPDDYIAIIDLKSLEVTGRL